jgi:hypothetical protein
MAWPEHYPPDCPPAYAEAVERSFYRLVKTASPSETDLRSNYQKFPDKQWGNSLCKACGLSIFSTKEDALKTRQRIPALRDSLLAVALVAPSSGVVLHTTSIHAPSHHTWWLDDKYTEACHMLTMEEE